jgi:UDP-N-acetylmuramate--alanine ligase
VLRGLAAFTGARRRFDRRGAAGGVTVVDDYAHHPTEVAAAVATAREVAGPGQVHVLFQPHLYSRTRLFATDFARALAGADTVVALDVYAAREDPEPGVDGGLVVAGVPHGRFVADRSRAVAEVAAAAVPGDLVLTVGAGDVGELADDLLAALGAVAAGATGAARTGPGAGDRRP